MAVLPVFVSDREMRSRKTVADMGKIREVPLTKRPCTGVESRLRRGETGPFHRKTDRHGNSLVYPLCK